jgi:hypothetical protein
MIKLNLYWTLLISCSLSIQALIRTPKKSMSTAPCVCATCTASRQSGTATRGTLENTVVRSLGNPRLGPSTQSQSHHPRSRAPNPAVLPQSSHPSLLPYPDLRSGWVPTHASLVNASAPRSLSRPPKTLAFQQLSFSKFTNLPVELRVRIWAFAQEPPRIIELRTWKSSQELRPLKISAGPHSVPSILHACRESRAEGLRIYQLEEIGISLWKDFDPSKIYIPWRYHPANHYADPEYQVQGTYTRDQWPRNHYGAHRQVSADLVMPYAPQRIYLDYNRDTVYLGPEFSSLFLRDFLSSPPWFRELSNVQYLALDRKLWLHQQATDWDEVRSNLYTLKNRPVKGIYIIPDDCRMPLEDRYYYGKHTLTFKEPAFYYRNTPARDFGPIEKLQAWFDRVWRRKSSPRSRITSHDTSAPRCTDITVPRVSFKSVRRAGMSMSDYKEGALEVQRSLGDVSRWLMWIPPAEDD